MWNVKRVLILVCSFVASVICFAIYVFFLGHINALGALPEEYVKIIGPDQPPPPPPVVDAKLIQAFGPNCSEKQWPLRLWLADKGIVFAASDFSIEKDGKVKMEPLSVALYHKSKTPGAFPEISTIKCDVALITLDRPVSSYSELNNRDVIGVEMIGKRPGIVITNNRRTAEKTDDVDILITNGNLFYKKTDDLIWTDGVVCLRDYQSKPPTEVRGKGLKMHLAKETKASPTRAANKLQPAKPANDNGNVEKIHLLADVDMHFWVDAKAGFLGGEPNVKNVKVNNAKPPEKAQIHIKTGGPFVYDLTKETAWFESPPLRDDSGGPIAPDQLHVERLQTVDGKVTYDQLTCDRLDLQFRKRVNPVDAGIAGGGDKEIETAHATRRDKNEVVLSLDSEKMAAYGSELFYRAGDANKGPETFLKGEPLKTVKEGHKMVCRELYLYSANRAGDGQKVIAKGKGQIDLIDTKNPEKTWPTHVLWDDTLDIVRKKEGESVFDLITVTGDASFIDDAQKQELHGNKIMVWVRQLQEGNAKAEAIGGPRQELHRVEAIDRVRASSPEFIIRQANRLNMLFLPQAPPSLRLPDLKVAASPVAMKKDPVPMPPMIEGLGKTTEPPPPLFIGKEPVAGVEAKKAPEKKNPPIELFGRDITGTVFTLGGKKELQDLVVKGNVHVYQPGDKPGEKRIDITGDLLTVKYAEKGHALVVHGDEKNLARLEMGDMILWGPIVKLDKGENRADIDGRGAMKVPSNKNLDGTDAPKDKSGNLIIHWNKSMNFDGRMAIFHGGVQGFQGDYSKMQCESLTAFFDKFISFADGQREHQNAKIDKIYCDKNVYIDDSKTDERKQLVQRNVLFGSLLTVDNLEGGTNLSGPGEVRLLARGNSGLNIGMPADGKAQPAQQEWKLTHVKFADRMFSNTKSATKNAIFRGHNSGVEVFHFATTDINAKMNADRPAKDQLYLRCGELHVEGRQFVDRTTQSMIAKHNVEFRTDKYLGYADVVKYDESTEIVIFEGVNGNPVRLYEIVDGAPRQFSVTTSKVLYNRKTGSIDGAGVKSLSN